MSTKFIALAAAAVAGAVVSQPVVAADISGAGATFPYPIYAKWADAYKKDTGIGLNYQSIGSGGGIKQIKAKTVTFGASDKPLPGKELDEVRSCAVPDGHGRHRAGREPRRHQARRARPRRHRRLPNIFLGKIKTWDDAAIKKLNPDAKLPSAAIAVVHRSDGSGTTYNFTYYLAAVSPEWKDKVGTRDVARVARRHRRQGQRGRRQQRRPDGRLDRLRRVCLRQAEQADPHRHDEQGRQAGQADLGSLRRRRRQRRLEQRCPATASSSPTSPAPTPGR